MLSNALRVVISWPKCWKMHHRHSKFQKFPGGACPRTPPPLVPRGLRPLALSQPPTFVFQPPTSKLAETPVPWQRLNWYWFNQHTVVFLDKFYEKSPNVVAVAVFVAKIRIFEISAGTLCPPCKLGLR